MSCQKIIAVGIEFEFGEELKDELISFLNPNNKNHPRADNIEKRPLISEKKAGVMYSVNCNTKGWTHFNNTPKEMEKWYNKNKDSPVIAHMRRMYVSKDVIILCGSTDGQKHFSIMISNKTKGNNLWFHLKNVNNGQYGKPVDIDVKLSGNAYVYYDPKA